MGKFKKITLGVLILIIVIPILMILPYYIDPLLLDTSNPLSIEEVQDILASRYEVTNIYTKSTSKPKDGELDNLSLYSEIYIKDNMAKRITYYENGKRKITQEDRENNKIIHISEIDSNIIDFKNNLTFGVYHPFINPDSDYLSYYDRVKYLGRTKIEERDTIVVKLEKDNMPVKTIYYIDVETGILSKEVIKYPFSTITYKREIKLGVVTDNDVQFIDYETVYPNFQYVEMPNSNDDINTD